MASERSLHYKIQVVLDIAASSSVSSSSALASAIAERRIPTFFSRRYVRDTDSFELDVSPKSIGRIIKLCELLGLLDPSGLLTYVGLRSLSRALFDECVSGQVAMVLERHGLSIQAMNDRIREGLSSETISLPTAQWLWEPYRNDIDFGLFSVLLGLLSHTHSATVSQRKLFLSFP